MRPCTTFLLVRHGHTAENGIGTHVRMSGWTDVPLSDRGEAEASAIAAYLGREGRPEVIYSSPLRRARSTAAPIARSCGVKVVLEPGLREINCGAADGLSLEAVKQRYPDEWGRNMAQDDPDFRWPGGESYRELRERCLSTLRALCAAHPSGRVVLVTHAGVISQVLGSLEGTSPACWEALRPRNGSVTELLWCEDSVRRVRFDWRPEPEQTGSVAEPRRAG